jgi:hypothetical protein
MELLHIHIAEVIPKEFRCTTFHTSNILTHQPLLIFYHFTTGSGWQQETIIIYNTIILQ